VELQLVGPDPFEKAKTRAEAEAILRKRARDPALYGDGEVPQVLVRVPETEYGRVEELLKTLNMFAH
jgi:hypothetical protein